MNKRMKWLRTNNKTLFLGVALGLAAAAIITLTFATQYFVAIEPETAIKTNITTQSDVAASGGQYIRFNSQTDPGGSSITHGEDVNTTNTGLLGAGYTYNSSTDAYTHPSKGALTQTGSITTSTDGQIIEGVDVSGLIKIQHKNVTVRNCRVKYTGNNYAIDDRGDGTVIEYCEVINSGSEPWDGFGIILWGNNSSTVRYNNVHRHQTGVYVNGQNKQIEHNYVWGMESTSGVHGTGMSINIGGGSNSTFYRNNIEGNSSSALALYSHQTLSNILVKQNLFNGGNGGSYCLNAGDNKNGESNSSIAIIQNKFGRKQYPQCGTYGPVFSWSSSQPGNVWYENSWQDTGLLVGTNSGDPTPYIN